MLATGSIQAGEISYLLRILCTPQTIRITADHCQKQ